MARRRTRAALVGLLLAGSAACSRQSDSATARWEFELDVGEPFNVVLAGPPAAGCTDRVLEPSILVRPRQGEAADAPDTLTVSFTRLAFAEVAERGGFVRDESDAYWRAGASERADSAVEWSGEGWRALEGGGVTRFERPDHAPDEAAVVFDEFLLSLARYQRADDCALVLRMFQAGGGASAEALFRSVRLRPAALR